VGRNNRRNVNSLSGAGREAYIAKLSKMLQEAEGLSLGDDNEGGPAVPMAEDAQGGGGGDSDADDSKDSDDHDEDLDSDNDENSDDDEDGTEMKTKKIRVKLRG
jgi:hypothetical protein